MIGRLAVGAATAISLLLSGSEVASQSPNAAKLLKPSALTERAPATFKANLDTTKGPIVIEVHRDWAPLAADRFYNLAKNGFYDEARFFRVVPNYLVQFGINADPAVTKAWAGALIADEPTKQGNKKGYVAFARGAAQNSRGTQLFINFKDNTSLDSQGFPAFGQVVVGLDAAQRITAEYGETPDAGRIALGGNSYLRKQFPKLDYIKTATIQP